MAGMSREARAQFDARGRKQERLSSYFDFDVEPDKAYLKVTRIELLAVLTAIEKGKKQGGFLSRLWRFLRRPLRDRVPAVEPTKGEVERGEMKAT